MAGMSTVRLEAVATEAKREIPMQPASLDIWDKKYRLKTKQGVALDADIDGTYQRVAKALAEAEPTVELQQYWMERFTWALRRGAIPAGRITSNAGALEHKPATSTINCTVSGTIEDSMDGILDKVHEAGLTLKAGCGIGYEFSTLRPRGAFVAGAGAYTSGPMSFMDIYDKMCFTVSSAGGRRGAQMGTFDVSHPDVKDFIRAKREDGRLRQFNLSLLITDEFMQAVRWPGRLPHLRPHPRPPPVGHDHGLDVRLRRAGLHPDRPRQRDEQQLVVRDHPRHQPLRRAAAAALRRLPAGFGQPDQVRARSLHRPGHVRLGGIQGSGARVHPHAGQRGRGQRPAVAAAARRDRPQAPPRHGLPRPGQHRDERIARDMAVAGWEMGLALAKEKGAAPIMEERFEVTAEMLRKRPEMVKDGWKLGQQIEGKTLHARYSRYMQRVAGVAPELVEELAEVGARFTHHSSIAPTGTISLSLANNASNGIEPSFAHHYSRNVIREGKKTKEKVDVYSFELLAYRELVNPKAMPFAEDAAARLPDYFISADDVKPKEHVDVQAAAQKWVDSSISKTANVPTDFPYEDFKDIYRYAHQQGLKGCTTFRFNPAAFQGVLVKEADLENTLYRFELEDGSMVEVKGNEQIEYDGELHTAANLFDALKEGYYGKF